MIDLSVAKLESLKSEDFKLDMILIIFKSVLNISGNAKKINNIYVFKSIKKNILLTIMLLMF
jgi:replicative DNA helicase